MEALALDMDGVVVDSVEYWSAVRESLIEELLGVKDVDGSDLVGMNAHDEYDYPTVDYDLDCPREEYVDGVEEHAAEIYRDRVEVLPGLDSVLRSAEQNDVKVAMVSASYRRRVEMVVERFDLFDHLDAVVAADDISGASKPDPALYEHAISILETPAGRCVAVEDSEHGVEAATCAGLYCIGYDNHADERLDDADEVIVHRGELLERLLSLCRSA